MIKAGNPGGGLAASKQSRRHTDQVAAACRGTLHSQGHQWFIAREINALETPRATWIAILVELIGGSLLDKLLVAHPLNQHTAQLGVLLTQGLLRGNRLGLESDPRGNRYIVPTQLHTVQRGWKRGQRGIT